MKTVNTRIRPWPHPELEGTCWGHDCPDPVAWLILFEPPVMGTPFAAVCDKHLYEFETETSG